VTSPDFLKYLIELAEYDPKYLIIIVSSVVSSMLLIYGLTAYAVLRRSLLPYISSIVFSSVFCYLALIVADQSYVAHVVASTLHIPEHYLDLEKCISLIKKHIASIQSIISTLGYVHTFAVTTLLIIVCLLGFKVGLAAVLMLLLSKFMTGVFTALTAVLSVLISLSRIYTGLVVLHAILDFLHFVLPFMTLAGAVFLACAPLRRLGITLIVFSYVFAFGFPFIISYSLEKGEFGIDVSHLYYETIVLGSGNFTVIDASGYPIPYALLVLHDVSNTSRFYAFQVLDNGFKSTVLPCGTYDLDVITLWCSLSSNCSRVVIEPNLSFKLCNLSVLTANVLAANASVQFLDFSNASRFCIQVPYIVIARRGGVSGIVFYSDVNVTARGDNVVSLVKVLPVNSSFSFTCIASNVIVSYQCSNPNMTVTYSISHVSNPALNVIPEAFFRNLYSNYCVWYNFVIAPIITWIEETGPLGGYEIPYYEFLCRLKPDPFFYYDPSPHVLRVSIEVVAVNETRPNDYAIVQIDVYGVDVTWSKWNWLVYTPYMEYGRYLVKEMSKLWFPLREYAALWYNVFSWLIPLVLSADVLSGLFGGYSISFRLLGLITPLFRGSAARVYGVALSTTMHVAMVLMRRMYLMAHQYIARYTPVMLLRRLIAPTPFIKLRELPVFTRFRVYVEAVRSVLETRIPRKFASVIAHTATALGISTSAIFRAIIHRHPLTLGLQFIASLYKHYLATRRGYFAVDESKFLRFVEIASRLAAAQRSLFHTLLVLASISEKIAMFVSRVSTSKAAAVRVLGELLSIRHVSELVEKYLPPPDVRTFRDIVSAVRSLHHEVERYVRGLDEIRRPITSEDLKYIIAGFYTRFLGYGFYGIELAKKLQSLVTTVYKLSRIAPPTSLQDLSVLRSKIELLRRGDFSQLISLAHYFRNLKVVVPPMPSLPAIKVVHGWIHLLVPGTPRLATISEVAEYVSELHTTLQYVRSLSEQYIVDPERVKYVFDTIQRHVADVVQGVCDKLVTRLRLLDIHDLAREVVLALARISPDSVHQVHALIREFEDRVRSAISTAIIMRDYSVLEEFANVVPELGLPTKITVTVSPERAHEYGLDIKQSITLELNLRDLPRFLAELDSLCFTCSSERARAFAAAIADLFASSIAEAINEQILSKLELETWFLINVLTLREGKFIDVSTLSANDIATLMKYVPEYDYLVVDVLKRADERGKLREALLEALLLNLGVPPSEVYELKHMNTNELSKYVLEKYVVDERLRDVVDKHLKALDKVHVRTCEELYMLLHEYPLYIYTYREIS